MRISPSEPMPVRRGLTRARQRGRIGDALREAVDVDVVVADAVHLDEGQGGHRSR